MNLMSKMVGFGATMVALMLLIVGLAYYNMSQLSGALSTIGEVDLPLSNAMSTITEGQLSQSAWLERSLLAAELEITEELDNASKQFTLENEKIDHAIQVALSISSQSLIESRSEGKDLKQFKDSLATVSRHYDDYYKLGTELFELLNAGDIVRAESALKKAQAQSAELAGLTDPVAKKISADASNSAKDLVVSSQSALMSISVIGFLAVIAALGLSFFITRSILNQLGAEPSELKKIAEHLADGKLDIETSTNVTGVALSISKTVSKLREVISRIKISAEEVSMASEQVGQGNTNLSQRTQEQASSLEEVAASMEEMTSTVNQNAENANQANQLALEASQQAAEGGSIAEQAVTAMNEINTSSKKISEIIGVIDDISFQINLLALNAAVEAARAGDQGRGFAVVAAEVRNLAGRSASAAKEIKDLIQDSVDKVASGTQLVGETGHRLNEMVNSIKKVSDNVAEIAAASREQSDGIAQVNRAILQMDDMTQQNASLVEQAAASSEIVDAQAKGLRELVSFFVLESAEDHQEVISQDRPQYTIAQRHTYDSTPRQSSFQREQRSLSSPIREMVTADDEWEQF